MPSKTISTIEIANFTDPNIGYGIVQVHACWYNVTLVFNKTNVETGTNIGLIVYPDTNETSQILQIKNNNYYTAVNVSVAFIAYDQEAPIPGLCDSDYKTADLSVTENTEFIYVDTPTAAASELSIKLTNQSSVCNASISYIGYHFFLGRGDFSCQSYFTALRKMLTIKDIRHIGSLVCVQTYSSILNFMNLVQFRVYHCRTRNTDELTYLYQVLVLCLQQLYKVLMVMRPPMFQPTRFHVHHHYGNQIAVFLV